MINDRGETGATGATGAEGQGGATGADGAVGERGDTGQRGVDGVGERGPKGDHGQAGHDGEAGAAGADGAVGETGASNLFALKVMIAIVILGFGFFAIRTDGQQKELARAQAEITKQQALIVRQQAEINANAAKVEAARVKLRYESCLGTVVILKQFNNQQNGLRQIEKDNVLGSPAFLRSGIRERRIKLYKEGVIPLPKCGPLKSKE